MKIWAVQGLRVVSGFFHLLHFKDVWMHCSRKRDEPGPRRVGERSQATFLCFHISMEHDVSEGFGCSEYLYLIALFWQLAKILLVSISSKP